MDIWGSSSASAAVAAVHALAAQVHIHEGNNVNKATHSIVMRFKNSTPKFSGDIGESWINFVDQYQYVSGD